MPKKKNASSSSDSDSGPNDRTPPKKAKTASGGSKTSDGTIFELDKNRRVTVRAFKGKSYFDIREFYSKDGELAPGKKGISLTPEQWRKLLGMTDDINAALTEA